MAREQFDELIYNDLRVLDLTGEMGVYCGKLLADLGAEVIKIENPGGDAIRNIGPFVGDDPHPEKSLYWFQFNTSKKSITLDINTADGNAIFRRLAATSDIIIETFPPGYMDSLGLSYEILRREHPELIMTSITPFGQTGPYKDYKASDLIGVAMGGQMYLAGFPEEPPVRAGGSQGYYQSSLQATVGTLIALHFRDISGRGQHIDVSMQQAVSLSMETAMQFWDLNKHVRKRTGAQNPRAAYGVYPCKDGYVALQAGVYGWEALVAWMNEEGHAKELVDQRWVDHQYRRLHTDEIDAWLIPWLLDHTMEELYVGSQARKILATPVNTPKTLVESTQLNARDFFVEVDHPELGACYKYSGSPYRFDQIKWRLAHRAPQIGEHNLVIYGELGLSSDDLVALAGAGVI
ncbi:MAG: CoA transferase [Dehalococcoidia bacterium]|nr:CoA transferase [Dehalococcoidia bacterium]